MEPLNPCYNDDVGYISVFVVCVYDVLKNMAAILKIAAPIFKKKSVIFADLKYNIIYAILNQQTS